MLHCIFIIMTTSVCTCHTNVDQQEMVQDEYLNQWQEKACEDDRIKDQIVGYGNDNEQQKAWQDETKKMMPGI